MPFITIHYRTSVFTPAGWRDVSVSARAQQVSAGMATVTEVLAIDGEAPGYSMSRTGAKRQSFNGRAVAQREIGARKRLSACGVEARV